MPPLPVLLRILLDKAFTIISVFVLMFIERNKNIFRERVNKVAGIKVDLKVSTLLFVVALGEEAYALFTWSIYYESTLDLSS